MNLFGQRSIRFLKWLYFLPGVVFAGVADVQRVWIFANIAVGVCAIPNLIAVLSLNGVFFLLMKDYLTRRNRWTTAAVDKTGKTIRSAIQADHV